MLTRRLAELTLALGATVVLLAVASGREAGHAAEPAASVSWQGLVGDGPRASVNVGQRMIVLLKSPSLAERVAARGGAASGAQEQKWTSSLLAQQRLLRSRLEVQGVEIHSEFSFTHVLSGFSAALDATAVSLLERDSAVQGVYPVRIAYPTSISSDALERRSLASSVGNADLSLPGFDGRGVTIALLDTGVDRRHPSLLGSVASGVDIVDPTGDATAQTPPGRPNELERHGTELAGILISDRGPPATNGVARGASVFPIRVAGWQSDGKGGFAVYSRTDQLIEGLERAVDPNDDGDAHDAARVALVGVAAPYAGFADDPAARAVAGALDLDTLVVVPAGNDGPAGPGFGSISGPGGAPAALTVGAADMRAKTQEVHVSVRSGLELFVDTSLPLTGEFALGRSFTSALAAPGLESKRSSFASVRSYFNARGLSLVAGRAALVPAGRSPAVTARSAAQAGATAVLLYGASLPVGGLPLDEDTPIPVVAIRSTAARKLLAAIAAGRDAGVSIGRARAVENTDALDVAQFSSTGLAYDGRVKPDVVASGVSIATTEPETAGGTTRYGTVNGTSAAAAAVAGAAAVLAQARPSLGAPGLRSALVGSARKLPGLSLASQGAGVMSVGAAAAAELVADRATLALGNMHAAGWKHWQTVIVRNVSTRRVRVRVRFTPYAQGAAPVRFHAFPSRFTLPIGATKRVRLVAAVKSAPLGTASAEGSVVFASATGAVLRLPWLVTFAEPPDNVLGPLQLSTDSFTPSAAGPALLTFRAGQLTSDAGRDSVQPVALLRLELFDAEGNDVGTLATLRDLLPGHYAFGLTGRTPAGSALGKGRYRLRVTAVPSLPGPASNSDVAFTIR
jgi:subtilisin family serine protease